MQKEFEATKEPINANERTTGQNPTTAMESKADGEPEPASTSSAPGQAGSKAVTSIEVGDGEEANAGQSEHDPASEGPDAASIPDDSDADTTRPVHDADSEGPLGVAENEGRSDSELGADPETTNASHAVVQDNLSVEMQEEQLVQLLSLKADREAKEKKEQTAARNRKAAETRARKNSELKASLKPLSSGAVGNVPPPEHGRALISPIRSVLDHSPRVSRPP
ncbi:hypothetical protein HKX48_003150 [Thoreauomyces humboldtii]|nr:hypothetical protein HKX48_003150 [Thoreauomyces humboldtii]